MTGYNWLEESKLLVLGVVLFQKYLEVHPDKLEELKKLCDLQEVSQSTSMEVFNINMY